MLLPLWCLSSEPKLHNSMITDSFFSDLTRRNLKICNRVANDPWSFPTCRAEMRAVSLLPTEHTSWHSYPAVGVNLIPVSCPEPSALPLQTEHGLLQSSSVFCYMFFTRSDIWISDQNISHYHSQQLTMLPSDIVTPFWWDVLRDQGDNSSMPLSASLLCTILNGSNIVSYIAQLLCISADDNPLGLRSSNFLHTNQWRLSPFESF